MICLKLDEISLIKVIFKWNVDYPNNISSDFENYYINPKIYHTSTRIEKQEKIQIKIILKNSRIQLSHKYKNLIQEFTTQNTKLWNNRIIKFKKGHVEHFDHHKQNMKLLKSNESIENNFTIPTHMDKICIYSILFRRSHL